MVTIKIAVVTLALLCLIGLAVTGVVWVLRQWFGVVTVTPQNIGEFHYGTSDVPQHLRHCMSRLGSSTTPTNPFRQEGQRT